MHSPGFLSVPQISLARGLQNALPESSVWIDLLAFACGRGHGHMDKLVVPVSHQHLCLSCHSRMNSIPAQKTAKHMVVGVGRQTADIIAGINKFKRDFYLFFLKIF